MIAFALVLGAGAAGAAAVAEPPDAAPVKIERRLLVKERAWFVSAGPGYLARGDYYDNPALCAAAAYYLSERGGPEVRASLFLSSLSAAGREVFDRVGLSPDAARPLGWLAAGWRESLGYGKILVRGNVVHFELQGAAHAGVLFTDRAAQPSLALTAGVLVRVTPRIFAQLEVTALGAREPRASDTIVVGLLPMLTAGARL